MSDQIKPKYTFVEATDGSSTEESIVKKKIAKTMEITEEFSMFDVFSYISKMDKAIRDKTAELDGLKSMKEAYLKEIEEIKAQLGVEDFDSEYAKTLTEDSKES